MLLRLSATGVKYFATAIAVSPLLLQTTMQSASSVSAVVTAPEAIDSILVECRCVKMLLVLSVLTVLLLPISTAFSPSGSLCRLFVVHSRIDAVSAV